MAIKLPTVNNFSIGTVQTVLGNSDQAAYIVNYLDHIGAKTFMIEEDYVDKDYLVDYQKFYCRAFKDKGRYTTRVHFFRSPFTLAQFNGYL